MPNTLLVTVLIALALLIASCAPEPTPPPEPMPLPTAEAPETTYTYYWPVLMRAWSEMPAHTKRGVGVVYGMQPEPHYHARSVAEAGGGWWHNWSMWSARGQSVNQAEATFVPTMWNGRDQEMLALAEMCQRGFSGPLMILNEPDLRGQANKSPAEAVQILEQVYATCPGVHVVGPRLSHEDWTHGFPWIREFWRMWQAEYGTLPPVTPAIHGYFPASYWSKYLMDYRQLLKEFGWPKGTQIWVAEWNVPCAAGRTPEEQAPLFEAVARLLDESEMVAYHSPFALFVGPRYWPELECVQLRGEDGRLTAVGRIYRGQAQAAGAAYP